jgi:hypothetical protein
MITHHWLDISNHECLIESDTPHTAIAIEQLHYELLTSRRPG